MKFGPSQHQLAPNDPNAGWYLENTQGEAIKQLTIDKILAAMKYLEDRYPAGTPYYQASWVFHKLLGAELGPKMQNFLQVGPNDAAGLFMTDQRYYHDFMAILNSPQMRPQMRSDVLFAVIEAVKNASPYTGQQQDLQALRQAAAPQTPPQRAQEIDRSKNDRSKNGQPSRFEEAKPAAGQQPLYDHLIKDIQELERRILERDPDTVAIERLRDKKVAEVVNLFFHNAACDQNFLQNLKGQPDSVLEAVEKKFTEYEASGSATRGMRSDHKKILEEQISRIKKPGKESRVEEQKQSDGSLDVVFNANSPAFLNAYNHHPAPPAAPPAAASNISQYKKNGKTRFGGEVNIAPGIDDDTLRKWKKDNGFSSSSAPAKKDIVFDYDQKTGKIFVSAANRADVEAVLNKLNESPPKPPSPPAGRVHQRG